MMKPYRSGELRWGTLAARVVEMRFRFSSPVISKTGSLGDTGLFAFAAIRSCGGIDRISSIRDSSFPGEGAYAGHFGRAPFKVPNASSHLSPSRETR